MHTILGRLYVGDIIETVTGPQVVLGFPVIDPDGYYRTPDRCFVKHSGGVIVGRMSDKVLRISKAVTA